jgi:glutathione S-transferase
MKGADMSEIILHHYPTSPYAEKVRLAFGLKGVSWRSVYIPMIMPKPELMPLTGGYRRTPVMQIGADIYCDTLCILREVERRFPAPSFYPNGNRGLAHAVTWWAEKSLFDTAVGVAFGEMGDQLPEGFLKDRGEMSGRELSAVRIKSARPILVDQLRAQFTFLDNMLNKNPFLLAKQPSLADFAAYHPLWFIAKNCAKETSPLNKYPRIVEWMARMAAFGHGKATPMKAAEALEVAKAAKPSPAASTDPNDPGGRKPGQRVKVTPSEFGRVPVVGEIVASSADEIIIRRMDETVGEVLVHFPRAGFIVSPA